MCKCRSHGTFPLFGLQSSHLKICYYHQDLHRRPLRLGSRPGFYGDRRALLLIGAWPLPRRPGIGHALKRHPFSGLVDSAILLTKNGPLGALDSVARLNEAAAPSYLFKTPWSVFQDGPDGEPAGRRPEHAGAEARRDGACWVPRSRRRRLHGRIKGPGLGRHHDPRRPTPRADRRTGSRRSTSDRGASPAPIRFPPDNFKHSLTLFSKSFSSFPRAPRGATGSGHDGALTLSGAPFQGTWARSVAEDASPDYNSDAEGDRFSSWAIPGSLAVTKGILAGFDNDPSAGSPTETLLRLLLPLNDKVQWTSHDVAGSEPSTSPRSEHFTGPFNRNLNDASPAQGPCDPSSYHESSEQRAKPASTFYLINASLPEVGDQPGSIPSRRPSRMVLNTLPRQGRGHNEARASFVSRDKMNKLRCTDVVESCRSTDSGHRARLRSTKQPQGHLTDKGWQYIRNSIDLGTQHRIPIAPLGLDGHKGRTLKSSAARQFDA
ncbi:hypothetical protein V6N13_057506 [Hibiscus sabdariffa]